MAKAKTVDDTEFGDLDCSDVKLIKLTGVGQLYCYSGKIHREFFRNGMVAYDSLCDCKKESEE